MCIRSTVIVLFSCAIFSHLLFNDAGHSEAHEKLSEKHPDDILLQKGFIYACIGVVILIVLSTVYHKNVKLEKINPIYTAFSLQKNFTTLFETHSNDELFNCFTGIRVIIQFLSIIVHFFIAHIFTSEEMFQNWKDVEKWKDSPWFYLTLSAHLLTEMSFIISGICLADSFFRQRERGFVAIF